MLSRQVLRWCQRCPGITHGKSRQSVDRSRASDMPVDGSKPRANDLKKIKPALKGNASGQPRDVIRLKSLICIFLLTAQKL
jgi:hypothetical protein